MNSRFVGLAVAIGVVLASGAAQAQMTLDQAIRAAVSSNPRIGEASANRRAVEHEVRQAQGSLLPQIRVQGEYGSERFRRFDGLVVPGSNDWRTAGGEIGMVVTQTLFDGMSSINQIYRQMARSEAAAWRTMERAELVALDTVEAYLDILRYSASLQHAADNVAAHERLSGNVSRRFDGGRSGRGDSEQVRERLAAAQAVQAELRIRLEEAKASFRRSVGRDPGRLAGASRPRGVPRSRQEALNQTIAANPSILAAQADASAAEREFDASAGLFAPRVYLEGRLSSGRNSNQRIGAYDDATGKVKMDFPIFAGGSHVARRAELGERVTEAQLRKDSLRRSAFESVDRAWGAHTNSGSRVGSLSRQVTAARQVVSAYRGEYELGQRTLLDLLNAENGLFNAKLALESAKVVGVFSDYQLLATTGTLLAKLNIPAPSDSMAVSWDQRSAFPSLDTLMPKLR